MINLFLNYDFVKGVYINIMNDNKKGNGKTPKKRSPIMWLIIGSIVLSLGLNMITTSLMTPVSKEITYNEFMTMIDEGKVGEVEIKADRYIIHEKKEDKPEPTPEIILGFGMMPPVEETETVYYTGYIKDDRLLQKLDDNGISYSTPIEKSSPVVSFILSWIMPIVFLVVSFSILTRFMSKKMGGGGGIMGIGQSNAKMYNVENKTGISFKDVAGQEEAKESLNEIVDFLHNPAKYTAIGAKQPKGALLVGPPGTGKTLLAKAVAGEANVPFFSLSGSEFVEMFVGVGASRVRDLFKQAATKAPCIIFIDEIDAIGKSRDTQMTTNDEREQTLNQLLSEMDGFDTSKGLVVLAATNRPEILDKALLRPGRFDRRIIVEKPDLKGREDILKVHIKNVKTATDVDLHAMALATSGAVGADLANMVNEAALRAVRMGRQEVIQEDLMDSVEVIIAGKEKKDRILSKDEKRIVAFHEVGHALATALQKNTQPVQKITIVPRTMGALGYTMQMPDEEEKYLNNRDELLDEITVFLAGRAAEEVVFNTQTTGAANDIERATQMARQMITMFGMSEEFGMVGLESLTNRYLDGKSVAHCSEQTLTKVDAEVIKVMKKRYEIAKELLLDNMDALHKISEFLIEKETITGDEFMDIFNQVKEERNAIAETETEITE